MANDQNPQPQYGQTPGAAAPGTPFPLYDPANVAAGSSFHNPAAQPAPQPQFAAPMPPAPMPSAPMPPATALIPQPMPMPAPGMAPMPGGAPIPGMVPQPTFGTIATMGDRFLARLIDGVVLGAMAFALSFIASFAGAAIVLGTTSVDPTTGEPNTGAAMVLVLTVMAIMLIPFVLYEVLCIGLAGATLGKKAMGIKVVDLATGGRIGVGRAFVRYLLPALGVVVIVGGLLVYLSPFWDGENRNRGWHDKAAGDIVIKVRP